jgi:hypothetical protein
MLGEYQVRMKACNYYVGSTILCDNSAIATVQVGAVPAKPTGLTLTQVSPGHNISVAWDAVEDSDNYKIRWRAADASLGDPIYATTTQATIQLDEYGDWVVRVEACNDAGCSKPASKTITTERPIPLMTGLTVTTQKNSLFLNISWDNNGDYKHFIRVRELSLRGYKEFSVPAGRHKHRSNIRRYGDWVVSVKACYPGTYICSAYAKTSGSAEGTTPSRMSNFEAMDAERGDTAMAVSWDKTPHATRYEIKWRKRGGEFRHRDILKAPGNQTSAVINLPDSHDWVVRARACNVNLCGPAVTESVNVVVIVEVPVVAEIRNLHVSAKYASLYGNANWDDVHGATYYKVWYADTASGHMAPHIVPDSKHNFYVPGHGTWDFLVQACNDDGCFAAAHRVLKVYPPEE